MAPTSRRSNSSISGPRRQLYSSTGEQLAVRPPPFFANSPVDIHHGRHNTAQDRAALGCSVGLCNVATKRASPLQLATQAKARDRHTVALDVIRTQICEQATPPTHELEQPTAGMVVVLVASEMIG